MGTCTLKWQPYYYKEAKMAQYTDQNVHELVNEVTQAVRNVIDARVEVSRWPEHKRGFPRFALQTRETVAKALLLMVRQIEDDELEQTVCEMLDNVCSTEGDDFNEIFNELLEEVC
jgi:hypothetical protein